MKPTKTFSIAALSAILLASVFSPPAQARYFTREEVMECRNQGQNAGIGAMVGAGFGAAIGLIAGHGRAVPAVAGGLAGAAAGGLIGAGLSCDEQVYYVAHVDDHLRQRNYWEPYEDDNCRVFVTRSGYSRHHEVCRTYHSEYRTPRGWVGEDRTACWVNGGWRHGYEDEVIETVHYTRALPAYYVRPVPVYREHDHGFRHHPGYERGYYVR